MEAALNRLKTSAVGAGAETEAEVNEYLNIAIQTFGKICSIPITLRFPSPMGERARRERKAERQRAF
jgi:hypothetical protein